MQWQGWASLPSILISLQSLIVSKLETKEFSSFWFLCYGWSNIWLVTSSILSNLLLTLSVKTDLMISLLRNVIRMMISIGAGCDRAQAHIEPSNKIRVWTELKVRNERHRSANEKAILSRREERERKVLSFSSSVLLFSCFHFSKKSLYHSQFVLFRSYSLNPGCNFLFHSNHALNQIASEPFLHWNHSMMKRRASILGVDTEYFHEFW